MAGDDVCSPPPAQEIEVSIFGPGYGESIVIHIGDGQWLIVDSCIDSESKEPAALNYFSRLGLSPSDCVKLIVASHWHDDHVAGLARLVEACPRADVSFSAALTCKEFVTLTRALGRRSLMEHPGVREFSRVLEILVSRKSGQSVNPLLASASTRIFRRAFSDSSDCEVWALSPSSAEQVLAQLQIAKLLVNPAQPKTGIVDRSPNHAAVVLWVGIGPHVLLLGADLEETNDPNTGWSVIVASTTRPAEKGGVFKIPHHGSLNGHNADVWRDMLVGKPFALLTPFVNGGVVLPRSTDIARILENTPKAYITAPVRLAPARRREPSVERTIRETVKRIYPLWRSTGHIRLRARRDHPTNGWTVALFNGAMELSTLVPPAK